MTYCLKVYDAIRGLIYTMDDEIITRFNENSIRRCGANGALWSKKSEKVRRGPIQRTLQEITNNTDHNLQV